MIVGDTMSSRRKFLFVSLFILLDVFLIIGFLVIRDATFLNDLRKEVNTLSKLDVTKDRYNRKIKSRGNYAIVEKAIKEYLDNYAVNLQEVLEITNDEQLTTLLSYDNYSSDGPEFKKSLEYITVTRNDFNKKMDRLIDNLDEEKIASYIQKWTTDSYYVNLYQELMLDNTMRDDFNRTKDLLVKKKTTVNNILNVSEEVLKFLVLNKDSWTVEGGEIKFLTADLYGTYNSLIIKTKTS